MSPYSILESTVKADIETFESDMASNYPHCFQLAATADVPMSKFEAYFNGGDELSKIDQSLDEGTQLVRLLSLICSSSVLGKCGGGPGCFPCLCDLRCLIETVHPIEDCYWGTSADGRLQERSLGSLVRYKGACGAVYF